MAEVEATPKLKEIHDLYSSHDWRFGKTPEFSNSMEQKFVWGLVDFHFDVVKGNKINTGKVYSDCLRVDFIDELNEQLQQGYEYHPNSMAEMLRAVEGKFEGDDNIKQWCADLQAWLKD